MKQITKLFLFGFLTWLIPFVLSFFMYRNGQLIISETFFKSVMVVVGSLSGSILLILYFQQIINNFLLNGLIVGLVWLLINLFLDLLMVWRGFFVMTYIQYFQNIGLRYLSLLIFSLALAVVLKNYQDKSQSLKDEKSQDLSK